MSFQQFLNYRSGFSYPGTGSHGHSTDESLLQEAMIPCIHLSVSSILGSLVCSVFSLFLMIKRSCWFFGLFSSLFVSIEGWFPSSLHLEPKTQSPFIPPQSIIFLLMLRNFFFQRELNFSTLLYVVCVTTQQGDIGVRSLEQWGQYSSLAPRLRFYAAVTPWRLGRLSS